MLTGPLISYQNGLGSHGQKLNAGSEEGSLTLAAVVHLPQHTILA